MRRNRNHKWVCLFLAMMVLISGMCLEKIPADSYFSCKQTNAITKTDGIIAVLAGVLLWVSVAKTKSLRKPWGIVMLLCYGVYLAYLLML